MKNKILFLHFVFAVLFIFGCSAGNMPGGRQKAATGSAVSGAAATGAATSGAATGTGIYGIATEGEWYDVYSSDFENSTNRYELTSEGRGEKIIQYTKKGKKVGEFLFHKEGKSSVSLLYTGDDRMVYYRETAEKAGDKVSRAFYSLPVRKGEDGNDVIDLKKAKKLFSAGQIWDNQECYADSRYVILTDSRGKYIRYEIDSGKMTEEYPFKKGAAAYLDDSTLGVQAGEIYCHLLAEDSDEETLYCQNLESMEWIELGGHLSSGLEAAAYYPAEGIVVFTEIKDEGQNNSYYCRDFKRDRFFCLLSEDQLLQKACEEGLIREDEKKLCEELTIGGWFLSRGRLYVQYRMATFRELTCQIENAVFSVGVEATDLAYERGLSEYMRKEGCYQCCIWHEGREFVSGKARETDRDIALRANAAECRDIRDTTAIFVYVTPDGDLGCGGYDLAAGKPATLTKKEKRGVLEEELFENYDDVESLVPSVISHDSEMDLTDFNYEK